VLAEQHKSHRRAKASQKALQEVATQLEVQLVTASQKEGDAPHTQLINDQQNQIALLLSEKAALHARLVTLDGSSST